LKTKHVFDYTAFVEREDSIVR